MKLEQRVSRLEQQRYSTLGEILDALAAEPGAVPTVTISPALAEALAKTRWRKVK